MGLNNLAIGNGQGIYAAPCDEDSGFSIPGVDPGNYQLTIFDTNLDIVIASLSLTVDADGTNCDGGVTPGCDYEDVGVFNWFARLNTGIFRDDNQDGVEKDLARIRKAADLLSRYQCSKAWRLLQSNGLGGHLDAAIIEQMTRKHQNGRQR